VDGADEDDDLMTVKRVDHKFDGTPGSDEEEEDEEEAGAYTRPPLCST
jgi:hypothetical protein